MVYRLNPCSKTWRTPLKVSRSSCRVERTMIRMYYRSRRMNLDQALSRLEMTKSWYTRAWYRLKTSLGLQHQKYRRTTSTRVNKMEIILWNNTRRGSQSHVCRIETKSITSWNSHSIGNPHLTTHLQWHLNRIFSHLLPRLPSRCGGKTCTQGRHPTLSKRINNC